MKISPILFLKKTKNKQKHPLLLKHITLLTQILIFRKNIFYRIHTMHLWRELSVLNLL